MMLELEEFFSLIFVVIYPLDVSAEGLRAAVGRRQETRPLRLCWHLRSLGSPRERAGFTIPGVVGTG